MYKILYENRKIKNRPHVSLQRSSTSKDFKRKLNVRSRRFINDRGRKAFTCIKVLGDDVSKPHHWKLVADLSIDKKGNVFG